MAGALQINGVEHEEAHAFFACLRSHPWSELARRSPRGERGRFSPCG